ncbi:MAG: lysophospholipid acyltransferase family protein [Thermodesulfobacteriota bacterium]
MISDKKRKLVWSTRFASFYNSLLVKTFGINVSVTDRRNTSPRGGSNYLILSNHLSYLDIFIIFSIFPATFIASVDEVKDTFLLGKVTELSGGFFVERRNRSGLRREIESITDILRLGVNVVLFPEGTTSNGERVLPFKTPLLSMAEKGGVEILPLCIRYSRIDGEELNENNRDLVYYYGDMKFFDHFNKLLTVKSIDAELILLEKIDPDEAQSRKELASSVYGIINDTFLNGAAPDKAAAR